MPNDEGEWVTEQERPTEGKERPVMGRIWEFTKDISIKVSRKAEKHWKINSLRVEIASIRHNINNKYKELGRYVYESLNAHAIEEDSYKTTLTELFEELKTLESEILVRENRIELLEQEVREAAEVEAALAGGELVAADTDVTAEADEVEPEEHLDEVSAEAKQADVADKATEPPKLASDAQVKSQSKESEISTDKQHNT